MKTMRVLACAVSALLLATGAPGQLVRQANTTLNLPANLPAGTAFATENALGTLTFDEPIDLASLPGVKDVLFVVERNRGIQRVNLATMQKTTFLDLATFLGASGLNTPLLTNSENGFLSMAFHPNYRQNGHLYVFYSLSIGGQRHQRIARFTAIGTPGNYQAATSVNTASHQPIITQLDQFGNHNGGDLAFGPDGYLYISVGDEGDANDSRDNARRIAKDFFGAILRIDVDRKSGGLEPNPHDESSTTTVGDSAIHPNTYLVPPDNPFVNLPSDVNGDSTYNLLTFPTNRVRTEIYASGMRNPFRMNFDMPTGRLFVADVGQGTREEVNIVTKGFNGGWSWKEGTLNFTAGPGGATPAGYVSDAPIYDYPRTGTFGGASVTGGVVYRGNRLTELYEAYIFADYVSGNLWALRQQGSTWTPERLVASETGISAFGHDPRDGDVLMCKLADGLSDAGTIRRLVRTTITGTQPPALLSQTGAFTNPVANLSPQTGIVDYEPNVSFWSDFATKRRWFSIKNTTDTVGFNALGNWTFPTGMVWIKHFDLDTVRGDPQSRRKLETRILVKTASEVYGLSYRWRDDGTDADLVTEEGADVGYPVTVSGQPTTQTWHFPSRSECRACHTPVAGLALSFNTRQLNRDYTHGAVTRNLIGSLSAAGYFSAPVSTTNGLPAYIPANQASHSLESRVRSYLAVNCGQCHQPGGASLGYWDARRGTPTSLAGLINGLLVNSGDSSANRVIVPGDLAHSMLLKRLQGADGPRMPPLGTNELDPAGIELLTDWITEELPNRRSYSEWQTFHFGSTSAPDAQPTSDPDGDGLRNTVEFLTGTLPKGPTPPLGISVVSGTPGGSFTLQFAHPANRSGVIQTSTDLQNWTLWDVPGNSPFYPKNDLNRTLTGPAPGENSFFRLRLEEP